MTVAESASNTTRWAQQVQQMTSQIDQMKQQYGALTGLRGLGRVFDDPQLRDYLPQDWQAVYDAVKRGGYSGLNGRAGSIMRITRCSMPAKAWFRISSAMLAGHRR
jgi:type IV secretion system protein VirB5